MLPFASPRVDPTGLIQPESIRFDNPQVNPRFAGTAYLARMLRDNGPEYVEFARALCPEIPQLEGLLREVESRLGTSEELPGDLELCRNLAHKLSSLFCVCALLDPRKSK